MPVRSRGAKWEAALSRDGKRYRQGGFERKKDAEAWEKRILRMLDRGILPDTEALKQGFATTMEQLRVLTMRTVWRGTKGERTAELNSADIIETLGGDFPVADVDERVVLRVQMALQGKGYDNGTVNRKMAAFGRMLTLAAETGALTRRPRIKRLKEGPGRTRFLTIKEQDEMIRALGDVNAQVKALALFLVETGMRLGEALKLKWADIQGDRVILNDTKSGYNRTVPLTVKASAALKRMDMFDGGPFHGLSQSTVTLAWNKAKETMEWARGDKEVVPHCLRHTCASRLMMAGVNVIAIQRWLGHRSIEQTMRYAHLAPDGLEQARDTLESYQPA